MDRKKIGLALSGGGIRGLAHIGVLRVLEENKIPIDMIAGTSIGSLIGALYASEPNAKKLEKEVKNQNIGNLLDYTLSKYGLIKGKKIEEFLEKRLKNITFEDLKIPLYITAFDINNKREVVFTKGDVAKAIRASISVPGIFIPVESKKEILVDAGMVDPIPSEILKEKGAEIIIAVNVNNMKSKKPMYGESIGAKKGDKKLPSMLETTMKSLNIIGSEAAKADLVGDKVDFVINIFLEDINLLDYKKAEKAIEKGKMAARNSLKEIKKLTESHPFKSFLGELNKNINLKDIVKVEDPFKGKKLDKK